LKPNDLGLFDVQGNAFTWCLERFKPYSTRKGDEADKDREDELEIDGTDARVLRGGSFSNPASMVRSAHRTFYVLSVKDLGFSFRPARTLSLDDFIALRSRYAAPSTVKSSFIFQDKQH
jgi:formylglycine-generating enzyme required for sulfatase activity